MKKIEIKPFREFWQDCFNCIVYSLTEYSQDVPRLYYYNNMYVYKFTNETVSEGKTYSSIVPWTDNYRLLGELTTNMEKYKLFAINDPVSLVKEKLDQNKIVLVALDLYNWIREGLHYNKSHIVHMSLVIGYDDDSQELIVLETGNDMFAEHRVGYEDAAKAFAGADIHSRIYDLNKDMKVKMFTKDDLAFYAKDVIRTIEEVTEDESKVWNVEGFSSEDLDDVLNIIQTHMFSMQNRAYINAYMFEHVFVDDKVKGVSLSEGFREIEKKFEQLKGVCIKSQYRDNKLESIKGIKEKMFCMLKKEKDLWLQYIDNIDSLQYKQCYDR